MAKLIYGDRIGKNFPLKVGCAAVIFDLTGEKILLTKRTDNHLWCLPGGGMEPGESVEEACIREVYEETGLEVNIVKLIGVYSSPNRITEYEDGNRFQFVSLTFEAEITGGKLGLSNETTSTGFYTYNEIKSIKMLENHLERIEDAFKRQTASYIR